jgi:hypothetical protein
MEKEAHPERCGTERDRAFQKRHPLHASSRASAENGYVLPREKPNGHSEAGRYAEVAGPRKYQ